MDKEKQILSRLEQTEEEYLRNRRQLEETMDEMAQDKHRFVRELEELADYVRYLFQKQENEGPQEGLQQAYRLIGNTQEEGELMVKRTLRKLENTQEDQQLLYKKNVNRYEEELVALKKEKGW